MACRLLPMYNVAKAVGPMRPNLADDVKLVQALFRGAQQVGDPYVEGIPPVIVTGNCTPDLCAAILKYQKGFQGTSAHIVADGVIDPLPSRSGFEGDWDNKYSGGASSTLMVLCYRLFKRSKEKYMAIGDDLGLPWKPDPFVV